MNTNRKCTHCFIVKLWVGFTFLHLGHSNLTFRQLQSQVVICLFFSRKCHFTTQDICCTAQNCTRTHGQNVPIVKAWPNWIQRPLVAGLLFERLVKVIQPSIMWNVLSWMRTCHLCGIVSILCCRQNCTRTHGQMFLKAWPNWIQRPLVVGLLFERLVKVIQPSIMWRMFCHECAHVIFVVLYRFCAVDKSHVFLKGNVQQYA